MSYISIHSFMDIMPIKSKAPDTKSRALNLSIIIFKQLQTAVDLFPLRGFFELLLCPRGFSFACYKQADILTSLGKIANRQQKSVFIDCFVVLKTFLFSVLKPCLMIPSELTVRSPRSEIYLISR